MRPVPVGAIVFHIQHAYGVHRFSALSFRRGVGDPVEVTKAIELAHDRVRVQWLGDARIGPGASQHRNHRRMPGHAENPDVARLGKAAQAPARLDPIEAGMTASRMITDDGTSRP